MSLIPSTMLGTGGVTPQPFILDNSGLFENDIPRFLSRIWSTPTDQTTWTLSFWVKRTILANGSADEILGAFVSPSDAGRAQLSFSFSTDSFRLSKHFVTHLTTTALFRDTSDFIHMTIVWDANNGTPDDRVRIYVDGEQLTGFSSRSNPTLGQTFGPINSATGHSIGVSDVDFTSDRLTAYLSDYIFVDGQALDPTNFGETTSTGRWYPIEYTGTYGNNGFRLQFSNGANLGEDSSGNGNDWTVTNVLTSNDSPTKNLAIFNKNERNQTSSTFALGNTKITTGFGDTTATSTIGVESGKYYWEYNIDTVGTACNVGICNTEHTMETDMQLRSTAWGYKSTGQKTNTTNTAYGAAYTSGDVIGVALDMDTGDIEFFKNGSSQGVAFNTGLTGNIMRAAFSDDFGGGGGTVVTIVTSENSWTHSAPAGFVELSSNNLPPADVVPSEHMDTVLYTGNGSTQSLTNAGFKPDLMWIKNRDATDSHVLIDSVRGVGELLSSDSTNAEVTDADTITTFGSNGFSIGADVKVNTNTEDYVAWNWNTTGGSTVSNTDGTITSTVSTGILQGISIVNYTGNFTTGATVGHGLGSVPKLIIIKNRDTVRDWRVYHDAIGNAKTLFLNLPNAETTASEWNTTNPSSTVFTLGQINAVNESGSEHIAYCFTDVNGFSKFGSYTGNGSTDGPFVYTGFKPAFIMIKHSNGSNNWKIFDTAREPFNLTGGYLEPNNTSAEANLGGGNTTDLDILSNGFKLRGNASTVNGNTSFNYVYLAFAEYPFSR